MIPPNAMLHEAAAEAGDLLDALHRLLRQTGAFDGEAGDALHTLATKARDDVREIAERLDPIHVSILPAAPPSRPASGNGGVVVNFQPRTPKDH